MSNHDETRTARGEILQNMAGTVDRASLEWRAALDRVGRLSPRELEVFLLLSSGQPNVELARRLFVTERTVKAHVGSILRKLELAGRLQVALTAIAFGQSQAAVPGGFDAP